MVVFPSPSFYMLGFRFLVVLSALSLAGISRTTSAQSSTWLRDTIEKRGWQYVTTIDSVGLNGLRPDVFGDTVLYKFNAASNGRRVLVSTDGGNSIDHEWAYPRSGSNYLMAQFASDPVEVRYPFYPSGTTTDSLFFTFDLGKTWVARTCDTSGMNFPIYTKWRRGWLDPTQDGTIYLELGDSIRSDLAIPSSYIVRSQDTGKTWRLMNLPDPSCGVGTLRGMLMDLRQHGLWYTLVSDKDLQCPRWYRTTDNGDHLECCVHGPALDQEGQLGGLRYSGEICSPWGPDLDGFRLRRGYRSRNAYGENDTILDWADELLPGRPDTLRAAHGSIFGFSPDGLFFNFQIQPKRPEVLLLPITEIWSDSSSSHKFQYWFFSSDAGAHWTNIWKDTMEVRVTLDKRRPGIVWMTATDQRWGEVANATYLVFKKDALQRGSVRTSPDASEMSVPTLIIRANGLAVMRNTRYVDLKIVDVLGRQFYSQRLNTSLTSQTFIISFPLSNEQYYGVLRSKQGAMVVVPVQIER